MASILDNNKATPYAAALNREYSGDVLVWFLQDGYLYLDSNPITNPTKAKSAKQIAHPLFSAEDAEGGDHANGTGNIHVLDDKDPKPPAVPFGSCVAVTTTNTEKLTYAFGIRDADQTVCMISPVYSPLGDNKADGIGIASCTVKKAPAVFFIQKADGLNYIMMADPFCKFQTTTVFDWNPADKSHLAATVMAPKAGADVAPYIFYYQEKRKATGIYMAAVLSDDKHQVDSIGSLPSGPTPLAVCQFKGNTFLFYLDANYYVSWTKYSGVSWTPSTPLLKYDQTNPTDNDKPCKTVPESGLAAVADEANDRIVVTYKAFIDEDHPEVLPCTIYTFKVPLSAH